MNKSITYRSSQVYKTVRISDNMLVSNKNVVRGVIKISDALL